MKVGPVASHNTLVLVQKRILSRIWSDIYRDGRIKAHSITNNYGLVISTSIDRHLSRFAATPLWHLSHI